MLGLGVEPVRLGRASGPFLLAGALRDLLVVTGTVLVYAGTIELLYEPVADAHARGTG